MPSIIYERSTDLVLLAGLFVAPELCAKVDRQVFDLPVLQTLFDRIKSSQGNEASLYNELDAETARLMNQVVTMSNKGVKVMSAMRTVKLESLNRRIKQILSDISKREQNGEDCEGLVHTLNEFINERERIRG